MSIKITYKNNSSKLRLKNLVLFVDEKFNINSTKKFISNSEFLYMNDLLKSSDLKKNLLVFELSSKKKILIIVI